jgi:hypothetical protein
VFQFAEDTTAKCVFAILSTSVTSRFIFDAYLIFKSGKSNTVAILGKGKVTPKQAYVALRGPGG